MNDITNHVTSRELSERLAKLGVPQESLFYWVRHKDTEWELLFVNTWAGKREGWHEVTSAFLSSELLDILPKRLEGDHPLWYLTIHCNDKYFSVDYETFNGNIEKDFGSRDKKEAEACGLMLEYLYKNNLITVTK